MNQVIRFQEVTKRYQMGEVVIPAANGVTFDVQEGEFAIIVGPSGAGKTTILNILGGIDRCDGGELQVGNRDLSKVTSKELCLYRRNDVGFVFQFYNLIQNLTAKENVEIATQLVKHPMDAKVALESVGLQERMDNFPSQLSGGEQQRVAIARALAKKPRLLLCDEPTGALDYQTGRSILKMLQEMCISDHMTVVLVTHNQALTPLANRVIKLKNGKVDAVVLNEHPKSIDDIEW
ncbi:MAG: ABC transporter ATP-binding protein [Erysipelotrichaceae bacterium]